MLKTQGLAQKLALLKHNLEARAQQLGSQVDTAATEATEAFAGSQQFLDSARSDIADVKKFVADLNAATNGAPQ